MDEHNTSGVRFIGPYVLSHAPPLALTTLHLGDIPEMVRVLNINQEVYNGTAAWEYPYKGEHARFRITRALAYHSDKGINTHWAMREHVDGPLIGLIAVYEPPEEQGTVYLSYWISPEHSGKGHTSRAAAFVKDEIAIKGMGAKVFIASAFTWNMASRRILEKLRMESVEST